MIEAIQTIFIRDLNKLKAEVSAYRSNDTMWVVEKNISNSAGNLCLHLIGNLNAFIGAELGNTGYVRKRKIEFSDKNVSTAQLLEGIDDTIEMVKSTLSQLNQEQLEKEYPLVVFKEKMTTEFFLIHLSTHLSYHLGQINYHRRMLDI